MDREHRVELYEAGPALGAQAPILLTHFDGAMDAGAAGNLAISQLLRTLRSQRVLTFDADVLIDYRSHRPIMTVEDWVTTGIEMPEIALDLVHDDLGRPILVLHGPEPDARWEAFAQTVAEIAHDAGVEVSVSLHGIPSGVPHTRQTPVHVQATDASLVPDQPHMAGLMQFPAPMSSFLQERLSTTGIEGISMLAAVPYYMAENAYPKAASALLGRLGEFAHLTLPVGDLEQGAVDDMGQIVRLVEANPEVSRTIEALERHYDALAGGQSDPTPSLPEGVWDGESGEDIGDVIEAYLANREQSERELAGDQDFDVEAEGIEEAGGTFGDSETIDEVLERLSDRKDEDPDQRRTRPQARHRLENPWDSAPPE